LEGVKTMRVFKLGDDGRIVEAALAEFRTAMPGLCDKVLEMGAEADNVPLSETRRSAELTDDSEVRMLLRDHVEDMLEFHKALKQKNHELREQLDRSNKFLEYYEAQHNIILRIVHNLKNYHD
jgi:hypothetical protein